MLRNEIIRAIESVAFVSDSSSRDCVYVEGCANEMADKVLEVLGKE